MSDFIEYLVAELKSKRLSKRDALALVREFPLCPSSSAASAVIHPLLQRNTSDLSEQRYSSMFTGEEFFLTDHRVRREGRSVDKVLPGVAYLEMARSAIEQASPTQRASSILELHNTVWAQPIVVVGNKQVHLALLASDNEGVEYEIYSQEGDQETVHGQGCAVWSHEPAPARLDLERLKGQIWSGAS